MLTTFDFYNTIENQIERTANCASHPVPDLTAYPTFIVYQGRSAQNRKRRGRPNRVRALMLDPNQCVAIVRWLSDHGDQSAKTTASTLWRKLRAEHPDSIGVWLHPSSWPTKLPEYNWRAIRKRANKRQRAIEALAIRDLHTAGVSA